MVVNISLLPPHIQAKIAKRLSFSDFINFEISSLAGRQIGKSSKPACRIASIDLHKDKAILLIYVPSIVRANRKEGWRRIVWEYISHMDLPIFSISKFEIKDDVTAERVDTFCNEINAIGEELHLTWWKKGEDQFKVFMKIAERFRITGFSECQYNLDQAIVRSPIFVEMMDHAILKTSVPDEIFLQMKAEYISGISLQSLESGGTLNQVFQQWFQRKRRICRFVIYVHINDKTIIPEHLFADLPYKLIWSKETHDGDWIPFNYCTKDYKKHTLYLIKRGDEYLKVNIDSYIGMRITAEEITEEEYQIGMKRPQEREQNPEITQTSELKATTRKSPTKIYPRKPCIIC